MLKISSHLGNECMRRRYRFTRWVECILQEMSLKKLEMTAGVQGSLATKKSGPHLGENLSEIMIPRDMHPLLCDENLMMSKNPRTWALSL